MKSRQIVLHDLNDVLKLVDVASLVSFQVEAVSGTKYLDAGSILGIMSLDLTEPIELHYDGEDENLENFVEAHRLSGEYSI